MNELTQALKDTVGKGTSFTLTQVGDEKEVTLSVVGGIASVTLKIPFGLDGPESCNGWTWKSNAVTAGFLRSAIAGMPDEASPRIVINTNDWDSGGLVLVGEWSVKRGRAKEGTPHYCSFLLDCGVLAVREE